MTKLLDILQNDKALNLSQQELEELTDLISSSRGFIYSKKLSDMSGLDVSKIEKALLKLAMESILTHWVVPKYKGKTLHDEARQGFSFDNFHEVLNKEDGYFDENLNSSITLLSAYKKNAS